MANKRDALVVVGIDFGTTYSGYGYSFRDEYKKDHSRVYSNTYWQSGDGPATSKIPTAILFNEGVFESFGYEAEQTYAQLLENGDTGGYCYFSRFKMKLFQEEIPDELIHPLLKINQSDCSFQEFERIELRIKPEDFKCVIRTESRMPCC